jgi:hypothetical protein
MSETRRNALGERDTNATSTASRPEGPTLGKRLKIRSMVTMAGEMLPFFWPMRGFIHHNPLHGLEHLPFEEAVAKASKLFHANGYLKRAEYQQLLERGSIERDVIESLAAELVSGWLGGQDQAVDEYMAELMRRCLVTMMTEARQPALGAEVPSSEEVLAAVKRRAS